jgi:hypothetical protein
MDKFNNYLSKTAFCMILLLILPFINVGQAIGAPPTTNVNVVNTPNVNVVNPTSRPLPVIERGPASQPFQASANGLFVFNQANMPLPLVTVPTGKQLIIEFATVGAFLDSTCSMDALIQTTAGGTTALHQLVVTQQGLLGGSLIFAAAQPMRLYADPGTSVLGSVNRDGTSCLLGGGAAMTISGYYVNIP